jgi:hypothetical protein
MEKNICLSRPTKNHPLAVPQDDALMPYLNSQKLVPRLAPALDNLHEFTSVEEYDVNSVLPAPKGPLETALITAEPFIVRHYLN